MKPELVKKDGRVFKISCEIDQSYLNPDYALSKELGTISATGWLPVMRLEPISGAGPSFVGRWDGGSRESGKQERFDLDFDICGVSKHEANWFKQGKNGYSGHHSTRTFSEAGWGYQVCLSTPSGAIFKGSVRLHLHREIEFKATLHIRGQFSSSRISRWERVWHTTFRRTCLKVRKYFRVARKAILRGLGHVALWVSRIGVIPQPGANEKLNGES